MALSLFDLNQPKNIFVPCCGMAALTLSVLGSLAAKRVASTGSKKEGKINPKYWETHNPALLPPGGECDMAVKLAHNFDNLCETPPLFYAACVALFALKGADASAVGLAWGYLVSRIVHTVIHTGNNHVPSRFFAFASSLVVIGSLWGKVLVAAIAA